MLIFKLNTIKQGNIMMNNRRKCK